MVKRHFRLHRKSGSTLVRGKHRRCCPTSRGGYNADFIPQNFASLPGSGAVEDIFVFTNLSQGNVLASAPDLAGPGNTDTDYTPLWQVNLVTWIKGRPTVLTSQGDISTAAQNGFVSVQKTPIIVECSVIFTPRWTVALGNGQIRAG
jgi:hypothetical protein